MGSTNTLNQLTRTLIFGFIGALFLMGCDNGKSVTIPEHRRVRQAPMNQNAAGVIVSGASETEVLNVLETQPHLSVRAVNPRHGLYEFFGASAADVRELFPSTVAVEKNQFVDLRSRLPKKIRKITKLARETVQKAEAKIAANKATQKIKTKPSVEPVAEEPAEETPTVTEDSGTGGTPLAFDHPYIMAIKNSQKIELTGELRDFVESCKLSRTLAPDVQVMTNTPIAKEENGLIVIVGETLVLDASKTVAKTKVPDLEFLWVLTSPDDSKVPPRASLNSSVQSTPDTTGLHIFSVIAKDVDSYCHLAMSGYYVTANVPYTPGPSFADGTVENLDPNAFWHVFHVGSAQSWKKTSGDDIVVGIIDSGVDYNHPALVRNIHINLGEIPDNGIDDDNNGFIDDVVGYDFGLDDPYPYDDYGHGTHVAGIAASNAVGAARKAKILTTKFGAGFGFDIASVAGAIRYSVDSGAHVLNMSFGWEEDFAVIRQAMEYAQKHNVLIVAASGNDGLNNDKTNSFPCNYELDNVLSIASSNERDELVFYSNYGKKVHLAAPGGSPEKMIYSSSKSNPKNTQFVGMMGTSMASPLVAGVAAQVWSVNPGLRAAQVRKILMDTGRESQALQSLKVPRVVDAEAAVAKAAELKGRALLLSTGPQ